MKADNKPVIEFTGIIWVCQKMKICFTKKKNKKTKGPKKKKVSKGERPSMC